MSKGLPTDLEVQTWQVEDHKMWVGFLGWVEGVLPGRAALERSKARHVESNHCLVVVHSEGKDPDVSSGVAHLVP